MFSDQSRRKKSREVSSRYLLPTVPPSSPPLAPPSPNTKHKHTGFIRGLLPSSHKQNPPTILSDHRKDGVKSSGNSPFLSKQRSCSEFRRSENNSSADNQNSRKENHTLVYGNGSMRFAGKLNFPGRSSILSISSSTSSSSSSKSQDFFDSNQVILPGRFSVDENALRRRSSYYFSDNSESGDLGSPVTTGRNFQTSYMTPTLSSRKSGIEVPSKYMKSTLKTVIKTAKWGSSPARIGSPPATSSSFSRCKPPSSCRKNFLHMGLDLIKLKKDGLSKSDLGSTESVHELKMMQSCWMQWRCVNARAEVVHENLASQCKDNLLYARESMTKLWQSVIRKRLQLQKEKLEMKLNFILHSQIKMLEAWGDMERQHVIDVSITKDCLHAVVCRVPLIEGVKADFESTSIILRQASHLVAIVKSMLSSFSPMAHETAATLSELLKIVVQEKLLLEECFEHFRTILTLEVQERSLRCSIIASDSLKEQRQQQQQRQQQIFV